MKTLPKFATKSTASNTRIPKTKTGFTYAGADEAYRSEAFTPVMLKMTFGSQHSARMLRFRAAGLYLVTTQSLSNRPTLDIVQAALDGGVTLLQLREKDLTIRDFTRLAYAVRELTYRYRALLIINDRLDIALACEADGVHLGQDDIPISDARRIAPELIIGASSHTIEEAIAAESAGASYVNVGPVFPTNTKVWTRDYLGIDGVRSISPHVHIPFTVMGGIKQEHIPDLVKTGATAIALVTAVTQADDPQKATTELLLAIRKK